MPFGLYIHWPFCRGKCPYCSFVSAPGMDNIIPSYINALENELHTNTKGVFSDSPHTLYIGGGTPSLISGGDIARLLTAADTSQTTEITIEANPDSCSPEWLGKIRDAGISRVSLGIQSLDDHILGNLGRLHSAGQAIQSFHNIQSTGFQSVSVDLMFGVPGQTMEIWEKTLTEIIALGPDHISAYSLGIEEDSEYYLMSMEKNLQLPDTSETSDMYSTLYSMLHKAGYEWYELSNFALPGKECLHNLSYWDFTPYMGIGVSAHSFNGLQRSWNIPDTVDYIRKIESGISVVDGVEEYSDITRTDEQIMLALRTRNGFSPTSLKLTNIQSQKLQTTLAEMKTAGFVQENPAGTYILTVKGAVIADELIAELITAIDQ